MTSTNLPVRADDPDTSYEAAVKASSRAATVRPIVLDIVEQFGPITHDEVIGQYHRKLITEPDTPHSSESGIRTRLSELVDRGLVMQSYEDGQSLFGNRSKRWVTTATLETLFSDDDETELIRFSMFEESDS